ncbi:hypothetical protein [Clostridium sp.]|jgi:hypothetical protein|uniref:hypothetical protein n=1 Tax=Clostridium sp. TaxID=1506 RepID=UPI002FDEE8B4
MAKSYNKSIFLKLQTKSSLLLFLVVFITEFIAGIYFSYFKGILLNDAFSRTANAFYVLYVKPIRLASIGFVWNPLPSILQLPFVALSKIWRPIVSSGISAVIITSISAGFSAVLLLKTFTKFNIQRKYSICIILLYITNPFIFFYGMNGMSEEPFFLAIIYIVTNMTLWMKKGKPEYIVKISFALAVAFLCRYEAIPFSAAVGIGVLINIFFNEKEKKFIPHNLKREKYYYAEGTTIVLYAPILYTILIWIFLNWTITGNPFYFLNSVYSNATQSQFTKPAGSYLEIILYILKRALPFLPPFFAIIITRLTTKRLVKNDFFILFVLIISMIIFHFLMLIKGSSYGWLRFFSYSLPICIAWIPYELSEFKKTLQPLFFNILCVFLIISSISTVIALSSPVIAIEEHYVVVSEQCTQISEYINEELPDDKVMMDSFLTSAIILNIKNIDNIVVSSNLNFNKYLNYPAKYGIKYIIVPDPDNGIGVLDSFNKKYPSLYRQGTDWCTLKKEFEGYKIFQVID